MAQIKEINAKLKPPSGVVITAGEIPLEIQPGDRYVPVNPSALLTRLTWSGSPSFPDIFGHFSASGEESRRRVRLHTAALKEISHRLHLHHAWGVEPSNDNVWNPAAASGSTRLTYAGVPQTGAT